MTTVIYIAKVVPAADGYTATFPDLPGLSVQREAIPQLIQASRERLLQALQLHEAEHGEWPGPTPIEALGGAAAPAGQLLLAVDVQVDDTPVRVNISLGEHLLKRLDDAAEAESMTRSGYIAAAVRQRLRMSAGPGFIDDAASQRLYQEVVAVGRRVNETLGPESPIGRTLTDLDNRATDGLRKLVDGLSSTLQFRPRDAGLERSPFADRTANGRPDDEDHPDLRDEEAPTNEQAQNGRTTMSKAGIEGATQKAAGSVKDAAGKITGNDKLRAEGMADKAAGSAKEAVGKAKDAVHKATK